jgi:hypothetical protein
MENEDKKKEETQTDITNKQNIIENEQNHNFEEKTTDDIHQGNHQKIKINEGLLKNKKNEMVIKSESNKENKIDDELTQKNDFIMSGQSYYDKIDRYLRGRRKKIVLIILLGISSLFLFISILDVVNSNKNIFNKDKLLINNVVIFTIQIIYIFSLLAFQILTLLSKIKDNFVINAIILLIIFIIMFVKIFLYSKNKNNNNFSILNLIINICFTFINLIILLITLRIIRMKKNEKQNIEEIINFTDIPQGATNMKINEKKDNQITFNSSGTENKIGSDNKNNKDGISNLLDEENNKEDGSDINEQK